MYNIPDIENQLHQEHLCNSHHLVDIIVKYLRPIYDKITRHFNAES